MKVIQIVACIACVLLNVGGTMNASKPADIIDSRAEVVLANIKKMDTAALRVGAETAHRVLKERMKRERTAEDWAWGAVGLLGVISGGGLTAYYRKDPIAAIFSIISIISANLIYAYCWKGPQLRLERAQLIANVFDRELGTAPDPCAVDVK